MTLEEYLVRNALGGLLEHSLRVEDYVGGKPRLSIRVAGDSPALEFVAIGNTLVSLSKEKEEAPPGPRHGR